MPTLLTAAGIAVPDGVQGRSLLPLTGGGRDPGRPGSAFVQISEDRVGRAVRTSRWKYAVEAPGADAWNDPDADRYTETELYDLAADPYELDNLAGLASHREVADGLRLELLDWLQRVENVKPRIERAAPRPPGQRRAESFPAETPWEGAVRSPRRSLTGSGSSGWPGPSLSRCARRAVRFVAELACWGRSSNCRRSAGRRKFDDRP